MNIRFPGFGRKEKELNVTLKEAQDLIKAAMIDEYPNMLDEAHSDALELLAREDLEFHKLGTNKTNEPIDDRIRRDTVKQSRTLAITDALTKHSVALYTNFGVGTGFSISTNNEKATKVINSFMLSPENIKVMGSQGQRALSDKLLIDGEIFFTFFTGPNGGVILRTVDTLEIVDIATDLEDQTESRYYRRVFGKRGDAVTKQIDYKDWTNIRNRPGELANGEIISQPTDASTPPVFHQKLEAVNLRGYPLVIAQIRWTRAYRAFMQSRISIQQSLARIVRQIKVKGGQKLVDKIKAQIQSSKVQTAGSERNPTQAFGSTEIANMSLESKNVKQETGAEAAKVDGGMIISMAGAAVGVFPHYFGFGESFRLATATAMEIPMLKAFEAYRELWKDTWLTIFNFVLTQNKVSLEGLVINISYPEIFPRDMATKINSVETAVNTFPSLRESDLLVKYTVGELGVNSPDSIVGEVSGISNDGSELGNSNSAESKHHNSEVARGILEVIKKASNSSNNETEISVHNDNEDSY